MGKKTKAIDEEEGEHSPTTAETTSKDEEE